MRFRQKLQPDTGKRISVPKDTIQQTNARWHTQSETRDKRHSETCSQNQPNYRITEDCGFDGQAEYEYDYEDNELLN